MSNRDVLNQSRTSLSSLVGTGSKREADGFDEEIIEISWQSSTGDKVSKYILGFMAVIGWSGNAEGRLVSFKTVMPG